MLPGDRAKETPRAGTNASNEQPWRFPDERRRYRRERRLGRPTRHQIEEFQCPEFMLRFHVFVGSSCVTAATTQARP
jgi:hypothetical protein